ncbi:MAG: hypothetical protein D8M54_24085 [Chloroflexi bacterium]|nr:hypothetical protein [Chloroflexota bacterium]
MVSFQDRATPPSHPEKEVEVTAVLSPPTNQQQQFPYVEPALLAACSRVIGAGGGTAVADYG